MFQFFDWVINFFKTIVDFITGLIESVISLISQIVSSMAFVRDTVVALPTFCQAAILGIIAVSIICVVVSFFVDVS